MEMGYPTIKLFWEWDMGWDIKSGIQYNKVSTGNMLLLYHFRFRMEFEQI